MLTFWMPFKLFQTVQVETDNLLQHGNKILIDSCLFHFRLNLSSNSLKSEGCSVSKASINFVQLTIFALNGNILLDAA